MTRPMLRCAALMIALAVLVSAMGVLAAPQEAQLPNLRMAAGDTAQVDCPSALTVQLRGAGSMAVICGAEAPVSTATPTAQATSTATPEPTATPPPTSTGVPPTATQLPTATQVATATATATATTPVAQAGQACPKALHDAVTTRGPDGRDYPTWHPAVDAATGCYFGHEHGGDPRTANANRELPPFGYIGSLIGDVEPHVGFKVFVLNKGTLLEAGNTAPDDTRLVFHMGTSGAGRYTTRFHSLIYDAIEPDGREIHVQGMADTGAAVGSTCSSPRQGGRDFSTVGCNDAYEIWAAKFKVEHPADPFTGINQVRAGVLTSVAAFDPVLTRDPADNARILYTEVYRNGPYAANPLDPRARYRGCAREFYAGPSFIANDASRPGAAAVYWTDAYGKVVTTGQAPGLLRQEVTIGPSSGTVQSKYRQDFCDATVRAPN